MLGSRTAEGAAGEGFVGGAAEGRPVEGGRASMTILVTRAWVVVAKDASKAPAASPKAGLPNVLPRSPAADPTMSASPYLSGVIDPGLFKPGYTIRNPGWRATRACYVPGQGAGHRVDVKRAAISVVIAGIRVTAASGRARNRTDFELLA